MREVLRAQAAVGVAGLAGDGGDLRDLAAVVVLVGARAEVGVALVGDEGDALARHVDRPHVVVGPEGELLHGALAVDARLVQVVVLVALVAHREHDLLAIEGEVEAADVDLVEVGGE